MSLGGIDFVRPFLIVTGCEKDLISGMYFLREYEAVMGIGERRKATENECLTVVWALPKFGACTH